MSRSGRSERDSRERRDPTPVDPLLRAAAGEIMRDEDEALNAPEVLHGFRDFVLNEFLPWTADEEARLAALASLSEDAESAVERAVEASYAERFRETVTALVTELRNRLPRLTRGSQGSPSRECPGDHCRGRHHGRGSGKVRGSSSGAQRMTCGTERDDLVTVPTIGDTFQ